MSKKNFHSALIHDYFVTVFAHNVFNLLLIDNKNKLKNIRKIRASKCVRLGILFQKKQNPTAGCKHINNQPVAYETNTPGATLSRQKNLKKSAR